MSYDAEFWLTVIEREIAKHLQGAWVAELGTAKGRLGCCKYRTRTIEISRHWLEHAPEEKMLDTIRHEVAHALAFEQHGCCQGHGPNWVLACQVTGANPEACYTISDEQAATVYAWETVCNECGKVTSRNIRKRSARSLQGRHSKCCLSPVTQRRAGQ